MRIRSVLFTRIIAIMKSTVTFVFVVLVLGGLFYFGSLGRADTETSVQGVGQNKKGESALTASDASYDFGTISMKDGNVTKEFTVTNPTDETVAITTVFTSCMCTTAFIVAPDGSVKGPFGMPGMGYVPPADDVVLPGESRTIRVVYDPNAHGPAGVGRINRFVTLTDASGGALQLEIKALVTP